MQIGVFGGTFDPVHWGHLVLAEEALTGAGLDRILFVPSGRPPHKPAGDLTPFEHRLAMVRAAVAGHDGFDVSDIESDESRPHFSYATLSRLASIHPDDQLHFVLGSDSLIDLKGWRNPGEIVDNFPLVVLPRPGFDPDMADPKLTRNMVVVRGITVSLSSTLVRRRMDGGASVRFLVPEAVREYARRHRLYGDAR